MRAHLPEDVIVEKLRDGARGRARLHVAQFLLAMLEDGDLVVAEDEGLTLHVEDGSSDGTRRQRNPDADDGLDAHLRVQIVHVHALLAVDADHLRRWCARGPGSNT